MAASVTKRIAELAARRHGIVTTADLVAAGLGRGAIARRVADGRLRQLHRGVFLVGPLKGAATDEMAAALACGPTSVVSHHAAAALWGFRPAWNGVIDVTVTRQVQDRQGIRVHRTRALDPRDVTRRVGIPLTTPARTLIDLAAPLGPRSLARAIEQAEIQRLTTRSELAALQARSSGRRGARVLARALQTAHEPQLTRSEAEAELLRLIRAARLPQPETNVRIAGYEVDFLWRAQRLVVEVDGFAYHRTREAFERDRRTDADLQARGLRTARVTYRQIADESHALIANLAASLNATVHPQPAI
jgi:very-short-patch-repair endonuclease